MKKILPPLPPTFSLRPLPRVDLSAPDPLAGLVFSILIPIALVVIAAQCSAYV